MTIEVSKTLVSLVRKHNSNIEYFIGETLGYLSEERCNLLRDLVIVTSGDTVTVELSEEICIELRTYFCETISLSQVINVVMLCGFLFGGV